MIVTTGQLLNKFKTYARPENKISCLVKKGEIFPVVRGIYETDDNVSGYLLASTICGPSYLSFEFALSWYGLIPEQAFAFTSATFNKRKKKVFSNRFGTYLYRDVPTDAYPLEIRILQENNYEFLLASPEKALCDKIYTVSPLANFEQVEEWLFEDMRIDKTALLQLDSETISLMANYYKCNNVKKLAAYLRRMK